MRLNVLKILKIVFFSQPNFSPDRPICSAKSWQTDKFTKLGFCHGVNLKSFFKVCPKLIDLSIVIYIVI
jgi:hypothetical protein